MTKGSPRVGPAFGALRRPITHSTPKRRHSSDWTIPDMVSTPSTNRKNKWNFFRRNKRLKLLTVTVADSYDSDDDENGTYFSEPEMSFDNGRNNSSIHDPRELRATRSASLSSDGRYSSRLGSSSDSDNPKMVLTNLKDGSMFSPINENVERELSSDPSRPSEDEDGTLFHAITSEGAEQVRAAAAAAAASRTTSPRVSSLHLPPSHIHAESLFSLVERQIISEMCCSTPGDPSQLPYSLLGQYAKLPFKIEKILNHGIFVCLSGLLYELTFMPLSALLTIVRLLSGSKHEISTVEKSDLCRTLVLITSVWLFNSNIDFSAVYHYIRAQSLLKLYLLFNMLEIIERLVRSWGNDILDSGVRSIVNDKFFSILVHWSGVLVYTVAHTYIHFWRVMLVSVAIVSTDSSMFMIVLTNNFAELKGTVFKKYEPRSLYPIIASDIVERMYLFVDVSLVVFRMLTSPQRRRMPFGEVAYWVGVMMVLEILTDWIKLLCVTKFNQIDVSTFDQYMRIHVSDTANARNRDHAPIPPLVHKGFISSSHLPVRRMNFMCTPLLVLILCNVMLPNLVGSDPLMLWGYRCLLVIGCFVLKIVVDWILLAYASQQSTEETLPEKLQNVRAL
jgi:hypothetical protein